MLTTFLSRADVSRNMQALHLLRELREAFIAHTTATNLLKTDALPAGWHGTHVRLGLLAGVPAWTVTVRTDLPGQPLRSVLQLHELSSGRLLAVMDATHLTALRTSLVGALATDILARETAADVAVLGSGAAASGALKALRLVRSIDRVWLHQPDDAANFELAMKLQSSLSMSVRAVDTAERAVADADIVLMTGGVSLPVSKLRAGTHVTVLAADSFTHTPLSETVLLDARRIGDGYSPELSWGQPLHASLGEVLGGAQVGRTSRDDVTVFTSVSPPFLDLVAAQHVFEGAQRDETLTRLDLEA